MPHFDLVIRGGTVAFGDGAPGEEVDVAISGNRIAAVGQHLASGVEELDARGKLVTPGFVDIHTHYDGQITWEETLAPSSGHGVTTVVMGNCGVGFAPCRPADRDLLLRLMEGVEDIPEVVMATGVPWNWQSFPDYLDALEMRRADIDFAAQLPHAALRVFVMGARGADLEPPSSGDLAAMRRLTAEAVRAGAVGVSTSRNLAHRFKTGRPAPTTRSEEAELLALAAGLADAGAGVFQLIPASDHDADDEFALIRKIAERSGRPVSFTMLTVASSDRPWRRYVANLIDAHREGLPIRGQFYPRPTGVLLGLDLSLNPFALNPSYRPIESLPLSEKLAALRDPLLRQRLLAEQPEDPNPFYMSLLSGRRLFKLGNPPNYNPPAADNLADLAAAAGRSPREYIYDALLEDEGRAILYSPMIEPHQSILAAQSLFGVGYAVLGLGDGGAHYGMICDAAYPTYLLTDWVRDGKGGDLGLDMAIKALAYDPAIALGFNDRGLVRAGRKADLNIIDLDRLHLDAPSAVRDLPANGRRLIQRATGFTATVVSGRVTYRDGVSTGERPGRLLRGGLPTQPDEKPVGWRS